MESDKKLNVTKYLTEKKFNPEQIELVLRMVDGACSKLLDDVIIALNKKKIKIENE